MNSFKEELQDLSDFVRRFAFWRTLLMIQIGCFIFGCVVNGILIPQNFFAGGLMGISLLIRTLSGDWISLSLLFILLNLPLFLLGYRSFSLRFLVISLMGMGILSLNLEWTEGMNIPTREPLLAAILGGILSGTGSGLYLRFGGSVGGLDILGAFLNTQIPDIDTEEQEREEDNDHEEEEEDDEEEEGPPLRYARPDSFLIPIGGVWKPGDDADAEPRWSKLPTEEEYRDERRREGDARRVIPCCDIS